MNAFIVNGTIESKYILLRLIERLIVGTTMVRVDMKIVVYSIKYKPSYPPIKYKKRCHRFGRLKA